MVLAFASANPIKYSSILVTDWNVQETLWSIAGVLRGQNMWNYIYRGINLCATFKEKRVSFKVTKELEKIVKLISGKR